MTEKALQRLSQIWQRRLRLQDWNLRVRLVRSYHSAMPDDSCGTVNIEWRQKEATIYVLDPGDIDPEQLKSWPRQDAESILVHELVHLHFAGLRIAPGTAEHDLEEQAILALEEALITAYR
jgi:hypothetical protein